MVHKCFISFKTEDIDYKNAIQNMPELDIIDKSLNNPVESDDEDYIMRVIRNKNLSDSTVTIFLIGSNSSENLGEEQQFIKRELQASLYNSEDNTRNGILGIVLPEMYDNVFRGATNCKTCNEELIIINTIDTTIKEFHRNYFINQEK